MTMLKRLPQPIVCSVLLLCCLLAGAHAWATPSAIQLLDEGRADDAIRVLTPQANGNNAEAYHLLCRAYYSVEDWDNAIRNCERAVKLEPNNAVYQLWMGRSYGEKASATKNLLFAYQLARKTVAAFARAHQLDPKNVPIARDLAEYYTAAPAIVGGSLEKARAIAAALVPEHPADAAWVRGMVATSAGHQEEAEREYNEAIRLDHDSASTNLDFASYLRGRKSWDQMQQTVEHAMQVQQIKPSDRFDAAILLLRTNRDLAGAARLMRAYIESEHTAEEAPLFRAHYLLGEILQKLGDSARAADEYRAALALANEYRPAADALRRMGQPLQAQTH
jgi:tetratricopeptide (TPR) repeat protein